MNNDLTDYYDALERLVKRKTKILPHGSVINFNNVAIEAGKSKGSIKATRHVYKKLRNDILQAKDLAGSSEHALRQQINKLTAEVAKYKALYELALVREISVVSQFLEMRDKLIAENEASDKHKLIPIFRKRDVGVQGHGG